VRLEFRATNNITEYEGLVLVLNKAKASGVKTLLMKTDSQVVTGQVEKEYLTHNTELAKYLAVVRCLERSSSQQPSPARRNLLPGP
jgi:ribonuclease HI